MVQRGARSRECPAVQTKGRGGGGGLAELFAGMFSHILNKRFWAETHPMNRECRAGSLRAGTPFYPSYEHL